MLTVNLTADEFSLPMPGAFPSSPILSPRLAPSEPDNEIPTEQLDRMDLGYGIAPPGFTTDHEPYPYRPPRTDLYPQPQMGRFPPVLRTELGSYLHPRGPKYATPNRQPPAMPIFAPPPPPQQPIQAEELLIDDPWTRKSTEFEKLPFGRPLSSVRLFTPTKAPLPANRTPPILTPEFERREKARQLQEREQRGPTRVRPHGDSVRAVPIEWISRVSMAMQAAQGVPVAKSLLGDDLYQKDIATCLKPLAWLNDEIINSYLTVIIDYLRQATGNTNGTPHFHAFNSFFYSALRDKGYQGVRRWASRAKIGGEKLLDVDTVFVPVHQSSHWTLVVVRPVDRTVEYFDSLGGRGQRQFEVIKEWLRGELGSKFDEEEWSLLPSSSSYQDNGSDCGVFLLTNAKAVALGLEPTCFQACHTMLLRRKIVAEIMNNGLHGEFNPIDKMGVTLL
ncbi:hypothetical protein N7492_006172 [Penicillium capsulatum]|uniref:Ubiquitin-like protease family profile domain-containing protein n=1 Tax=Penicillium capsulatum TaxID=69766 RepID=A0A9W9I111_9EURO|nr:hypothetical protein N7492_006172 [Penicillium capsulatum]KAJ6108823.1 hypothetical protein N7512_008660 [Penicillium capsulatum]